MKNFRTFISAVEFYRQIPALRLTGNLKEQLVRAGSSIVLNLAEGRGKPTVRDQAKSFNIAMGSVRECQAILILAQLENTAAGEKLDNLASQLFCLLRRMG